MFVTSTNDESLAGALRENGFELSIETTAAAAYERLLISPPELLVIDLSALSDGVELIKKIKSTGRSREILVLAIAEWGSGMPMLALSHGADALEKKPVDGKNLLRAIEQLLRPNMVMTAKASATNLADN